MISQVCGIVTDINYKQETTLDIKTSSGLVYTIHVVNNFIVPQLNEDICIYTELIVKEDSWTLFGFNDKMQRDWFNKLRGVSGIGAKTALAILGTYSLKQLINILQDSDATMLSKVKGLGVKGAKKIILDLQGVIAETSEQADKTILRELREALKSLGFSSEAISGFIDQAKAILETDKNIRIEELIEKVLRER